MYISCARRTVGDVLAAAVGTRRRRVLGQRAVSGYVVVGALQASRLQVAVGRGASSLQAPMTLNYEFFIHVSLERDAHVHNGRHFGVDRLDCDCVVHYY